MHEGGGKGPGPLDEGPVWVYGAGGHGKVVLDALDASGRTVAGFLDDDPALAGGEFMGLQVRSGSRLGDLDPPGVVVVALGDGGVRERVTARVREAGVPIVSAVHPSAVLGRGVKLGPGCMILAQAAVNPDTRLGRGVIVNTGATVDHDCIIGDFAHIAPGVRLAGEVRVGDRTLIGVGASVLPRVAIGADATVGGGSAVIRDVADRTTVVGNPARPLPGEDSA